MSESPKEENVAKRAKVDTSDAVENPKDEVASTAAVPIGFGTFGGGAVGFGGVASTGTGWLKAPTLGGAKPVFGSGFGSSSGGFGSFGSGSGALGGSIFGSSTLGGSDSKTGAPGLATAQVPTTFKFSAQPSGIESGSKDESPRGTKKDGDAKGDEKESKKAAEGEGDAGSGDEGEASNNAWSDIVAAPVLKTSSVELPTEEATSQATGEEGEELVFGLRAKLYELKRKPAKPAHDTSAPKASGSDEVAEKKEGEATDAEKTGASSSAGDEDSSASSSSSGAGSSSPAFEWRECGVGHLRVRSPAAETASSKEGASASGEEKQQRAAGRVVMRREKTEALILNVSVRGMAATAAGDKAVQFTCFKVVDEDDEKAAAASEASSSSSSSSEATTPVACTYLVKTKTKDEARDLLAATKAQIEAVEDTATAP